MDFDFSESLVYETMDIKPLTEEQIARNEKKLNMALDDIIKMSKRTTSSLRKPRELNKRQKFTSTGAGHQTSSDVQQFMVSRSSVRQGVLVHRRSNFQNNQSHLATALTKNSAPAPIHSRPLIRDRMVNFSKPRVGRTSLVWKRTTAESSPHKLQQQEDEVELVKKQGGPQTFNSFGDYVKEQNLNRVVVSLMH